MAVDFMSPRSRRLKAATRVMLLIAASLVGSEIFAQTGDRVQPSDLVAEYASLIQRFRASAGVPLTVSDEVLAQRIDGLLRGVRKVAESVKARSGADGSLTASARCADGFVVGRRINTSTSDVVLTEEVSADCDANGCRAIQVTARSQTPRAFDFEMTVACST